VPIATARIVVDASAAGAIVFREPEAARVIEPMLAAKVLLVPQLFWLELANIGRTKVLRGELDWAEAFAQIETTGAWPMEERSVPWRAALTLARGSALTVYDAAYLHLAIEAGAALLSLDDALLAAAPRRAI
jgi:predicted nucleic acid-binding protein